MTLFLNFHSLTQQKAILYLSQQDAKISKTQRRGNPLQSLMDGKRTHEPQFISGLDLYTEGMIHIKSLYVTFLARS